MKTKGTGKTHKDGLELEKIFEVQFNASQTPMFILPYRSSSVYANKMCKKTFGLPTERLTLAKLLSSLSKLTRDRKLRGLISKNSLTRRKILGEFLTKEGRYFEYSSTLLIDGDAALGRIWQFKDLTMRRHQDKQQEYFLGIASHELKTPLTNLRIAHQLLSTNLAEKSDEKSALYIEEMKSHLTDLEYIIGQFLDTSKIASNGFKVFKEPFDLDRLIKEIVFLLQRNTFTHEIVYQGEPHLKVKGSRKQISQVITNLVSNAIKYSPNCEKVLIKSYVKDESCIIEVIDYGLGISKNNQDKLFKPFSRIAHRWLGGDDKGAGLGLYISNEIVKNHGGAIEVKSRKRKGATFIVKLPLK